MKLKGSYDGSVSYSVGDVVRYTDGVVYILQRSCKAGTTPHNMLFWGRADGTTSAIVNIAMDAIEMAESKDITLEDDLTQATAGKKALDAHQGSVLKALIDAIVIPEVPDNINDSAIILNSSTEGSTKQFLITIYDPDEGDDPELTITEIVPDEDDDPPAEEEES